MHCLWVGVRLGGRLKQPLRLQRFIRAREPSLSIATHSSGKELHNTASFLSVFIFYFSFLILRVLLVLYPLFLESILISSLSRSFVDIVNQDILQP